MTRPGILRLAEDRILVEQVRLLCQHVARSIIPTFVLVGMIFWVISDAGDPEGTWVIGAWCVLTAMTKLGTWLHARWQLARGIHAGNARRLVYVLMAVNAYNGFVWGLLLWASLDSSTMVGSIFILALFAGVAAQGMSLLSPVVPVFMVFVLFQLVTGATKMLLLGGEDYTAVGLAGGLYVVIMVGQAVNNSRTARESIELRFENLSLLEKLRQETQLAETARRDAELANMAKSKFLAAASHDLRQPIHAQGLFLEVLSHTGLTPHQGEVLASARSACLASGEMLNTLLDFSRVDAGVAKPFVRPFLLQPLLRKIENDLAPLADAKGIVYRSRECAIAINSDATMVEMILRNLVSNAIRYTGKGGVLVGLRRREGRTVMEVWDTGIGIAPENQQEIFREFHQLGNPERDRRKGLGLGLAIADGLARALGHKLSVVSRPGQGTVFRLELPLWIGAVAATEHAVSQPLRPIRLPGLQVLVIDDDEAVLTGMAQLLRSWGCEVAAAGSISEALELAKLRAPDLIVSDYRLRGNQTGAEAIAALRSLLDKDVPALMITGDTAPDRLREALASDLPLLHKPVAPEQLFRSMTDAINEV
ncbi:hybrid sensor histidine kinase/response regulator [Polaromonas sp. YR568]|uniref:ATP-binding response regulator n=1 Tax=Polaromonas sp. YR568 TaxID=1855301 RepID=UPI00398BE35F